MIRRDRLARSRSPITARARPLPGVDAARRGTSREQAAPGSTRASRHQAASGAATADQARAPRSAGGAGAVCRVRRSPSDICTSASSAASRAHSTPGAGLRRARARACRPPTETDGDAAPGRVEQARAVGELGLEALGGDGDEQVRRRVEVRARRVRQPGREEDRASLPDRSRARATGRARRRAAASSRGSGSRRRAGAPRAARAGSRPRLEQQLRVVPVVDPAEEDEGSVSRRRRARAPAGGAVSPRGLGRHAERHDREQPRERRVLGKVARDRSARASKSAPA